MVFAQLCRFESGSLEARSAFERLLLGLKVDEADLPRFTNDCLRLHALAVEEAPELATRVASLSGLQESSDLQELASKRARVSEQLSLQQLALHSLAHLPAEWRGKRYRRTQGRLTENARAEGERTERLRKGREVAGLLVEAGLPFASSLTGRALEETSVLRCCRGLRAQTLAQRVSCWRPFRRYLLQAGLKP